MNAAESRTGTYMKRWLRPLVSLVVIALAVLGADLGLAFTGLSPWLKATLIAVVVVLLQVGERVVSRLTGRDAMGALELALLRSFSTRKVESAERSSHYRAPFLPREDVRVILEQALAVTQRDVRLQIVGREITGRAYLDAGPVHISAYCEPPREDDEVPEEIEDATRLARYVTVRLRFENTTVREAPKRLADLSALLGKIDGTVFEKRRLVRISDNASLEVKGWTDEQASLYTALAECRDTGESVMFTFTDRSIAAAGVLTSKAFRDMQSVVLLKARWSDAVMARA